MQRDRLERVWRRLAAHGAEACPDCGGPVPGYTASVLIDESEPDQPTQCSVCGLWLDQEGMPISAWRLKPGQIAETKVIILGCEAE